MNVCRLSLPVLALLVWSGFAAANPANKAAFAKHFGPLLAAEISCKLCHVSDHADGAASLEAFPHNPFGDALRIAGERLIDEGRESAIPHRIPLVAAVDSDGDGASNLDEILLGTAPGNAGDTPAETENLPMLRAQYDVRINDHQWRPFEPVEPPAVPPLPEEWGRNPIDAFVAARHQQLGLHREPEAEPEHLLRRVYLDLIGLNPTPQQVRTFVDQYADDPSAYERVVDRLLEHPEYGTRWARHWMDVWRYSDWAGYKDALRESQRHIWHWRDWIIESLNEDKGYDRMVTEMLAADELNLEADDLRATGYLARNYLTNRDQWMDNVVKHTSQAFMGVTLGCAKCHDHMTDPLTQVEYYSMRAIFEPYHVQTDRVPGELETGRNGIPRAYDRSLDAKTYLFEAGDERYPVKDEPIPPSVPASLGGEYRIEPVDRPLTAQLPDQRAFVIDALRSEAQQKVAAAKHEHQAAAARARLDALVAELELESRQRDGLEKDSEAWQNAARELHRLQRQAAVDEAQWELQQAQEKLDAAITRREQSESGGKATSVAAAKKAEATAKKAHQTASERLQNARKTLASELTVDFQPREQTRYPARSTGRRLALARWLTDHDHPLTARVAVNHLWLRHFGRGLVPTPNDFGYGGREPTHPALLDWLAAEFMRGNWSMKELHRLIVTSDTYRMASSGNPASQAIDPDNRFLWRSPVRRMEGEIVRDNLLWIADRMDATHGGPDIDQHKAQTSRRRSIYLRHAHEKLVEFVQIFDGPAVSECYQRERSIQPHQALAMANSQLAVDAAESISQQLKQRCADDLAFVQAAFLRILCRQPNEDESQACLNFLTQGTRPHFNLVLVLVNHNDFIAIR